MKTNNENDPRYEECVKEWKFMKKQLEEIKHSKLSIAFNENIYRLIQSRYDCACLKLIGYGF